jgi:hypothetical protein
MARSILRPYFLLPKRLPTETSTTAPTVAAARLPMKP